MVPLSKSGVRKHRGFESRPLRHVAHRSGGPCPRWRLRSLAHGLRVRSLACSAPPCLGPPLGRRARRSVSRHRPQSRPVSISAIAAERSPSGLWRRTGNAVRGNPSRVRIPPSPPHAVRVIGRPDEFRTATRRTTAITVPWRNVDQGQGLARDRRPSLGRTCAGGMQRPTGPRSALVGGSARSAREHCRAGAPAGWSQSEPSGKPTSATTVPRRNVGPRRNVRQGPLLARDRRPIPLARCAPGTAEADRTPT